MRGFYWYERNPDLFESEKQAIPALGEEFYLFRVETSDQKKAFIIACRYEVDAFSYSPSNS